VGLRSDTRPVASSSWALELRRGIVPQAVMKHAATLFVRPTFGRSRFYCGRLFLDAISTNLETVFKLRAVPVLAAGIFSFDLPMPLG